MNLRAPFRVASFEIRVTSKIRSRHDFRYKYGCLKINRGVAVTEMLRRGCRKTSKEKDDTRRNICSNLLYVTFRRRVIVEWPNRFAWVSDYLSVILSLEAVPRLEAASRQFFQVLVLVLAVKALVLVLVLRVTVSVLVLVLAHIVLLTSRGFDNLAI